MKRICTIFFCCLCMMLTNLRAQDSLSAADIAFLKHAKNYTCYKINPLSLVLGTLTLHHERTLDYERSTNISLFYFSGFAALRNIGITGAGLTPGYRYYFQTAYQNSPFIELFVKYHYFWISDRAVELNADILGGGFIAGKQWLWGKWKFECFMGPLYNFGDFSLTLRTRNITNGRIPVEMGLGPFNGYWFRAGLTLGRIW